MKHAGIVTLRYSNPKTGLCCEIALPAGLSTAKRMDEALRRLAELSGALEAKHEAIQAQWRRER